LEFKNNIIIFLKQLDTFNLVCFLIINISIFALIISIIVDFVFYNNKSNIKTEKKSIVETGSMTGYTILFCIMTGLDVGKINFDNYISFLITTGIGTLFILTGSIINIIGRIKLGNNWSNHIKIYSSHSLITHGIYKIVRHPLYASLMLMFFGGSLVFKNWICFLTLIFVFIPFMNYRAKQEEKLLIEEFPDYIEYKKSVGRFFPKLYLRRMYK